MPDRPASSRAAVVALLLTVGATAVVGSLLSGWPVPPVRGEAPVCPTAAALERAIDLTSVGDQTVLRARATAFAHALLDPALGSDGREAEGEPAHKSAGEPAGEAVGVAAGGTVAALSDEVRVSMGRQILDILDDPAATVAELAEAAAPVVRACREAAAGASS